MLKVNGFKNGPHVSFEFREKQPWEFVTLLYFGLRIPIFNDPKRSPSDVVPRASLHLSSRQSQFAMTFCFTCVRIEITFKGPLSPTLNIILQRT